MALPKAGVCIPASHPFILWRAFSTCQRARLRNLDATRPAVRRDDPVFAVIAFGRSRTGRVGKKSAGLTRQVAGKTFLAGWLSQWIIPHTPLGQHVRHL